MKILLDTEIISSFYDPNALDHSSILDGFERHKNSDIYISILTLFELEYGCANAPSQDHSPFRSMIDEVKNQFHILPLMEESSQLFGDLKAQIRRQRNLKKDSMKKHNIDIMLASTTIMTNCTLVSKDRIFQDISAFHEGFSVENWAT